MKRSAQVVLVLMGVTATTAAGAYMMPDRPSCEPGANTATGQPAAPKLNPDGTPAPQPQPCRKRNWGSWHWSSNSTRSYFSSSNTSSTNRTTSTPRSTTPSTRISATPRGGFGGIGHSFSSGG